MVAVQTSLVIVFLVLVLVSLACAGALWFMRRHRIAQRALLPQYSEKVEDPSPRQSYHKRVSAAVVSITGQAGLVTTDLSANSARPQSPSALPQIHITFPEEVDTDGKTQSGRVVVVHMDDKGAVGMEPVHPDDKPPAYSADGRFVSLDLERYGGLKEKESMPPRAQS